MSAVKAPMELEAGTPVQPPRDQWSLRRDEPSPSGSTGRRATTNGGYVSIRIVYLGIAVIVAAACVVNAFSVAHDLARRGRPYILSEPLLWEATSAAMVVALLALPRRSAILIGAIASRPLWAGASVLALAVAFSAIHIVGMVLLRELAYAAGGATYSFNWSLGEVLYEMRKDLFAFATITIMFWLAERAFGRNADAASEPADRAEPPQAAGQREDIAAFWLRDGRTSVLVDSRQILWVASAGNYVEYSLADGRQHLIRATLQSAAEHLSARGIVRVHRTRLVNLKRVTAVSWRSSGDFELRLDSGETISGSRRYKAAIAGMTANGRCA